MSDGILLFGRKTYEMMAYYWPSENARKNNAAVAEGRIRLTKLLLSKSLKKTDWGNTRIIKDDLEKGNKEIETAG
jgi:dihydrofolate reductase